MIVADRSPRCRAVVGTDGAALRHAGKIGEPASGDRLTYCGISTSVHDPGHCAQPGDSWRSRSAPGYGSSGPAVRSTPADRRGILKKNFCCVTTRGRNLLSFRRLRRGFGSLTAHAFGCSVLGLNPRILAAASLSPRRLPTADFAQADGILTVTLIRTLRLILPLAPFAQAEPRAGPPHFGGPFIGRSLTLGRPLTGITAVFGIIVAGAHGSCLSQGIARGECANILLGRLSKREPDQTGLCQSNPGSGNKTRKETGKETVLKSPAGRRPGRTQFRKALREGNVEGSSAYPHPRLAPSSRSKLARIS